MVNTTFIGVDPGESGAVGFITPEGSRVFDFEDGEALPFLQEVCSNPWVYGSEPVALIERVHSHPKWGVSSVFKFGANFGQWVGRFEALDVSLGFVAPTKWQKTMFGPHPKITMIRKGETKLNTKKMSLTIARQTFPDLKQQLLRARDDGRADALLITKYCQMLHGSSLNP